MGDSVKLVRDNTFFLKRKFEIEIYDVLYVIIGLPWLFLLITATRTLSDVKLSFSIALMLVAVLEIITKKVRFDSNSFVFLFIFEIYLFISLIVGVISGYGFSLANDSALIENFFLMPIFVFCLGAAINIKEQRKSFFWKSIVLVSFLLVFLDLLKIVLYRNGINPSILSFIMVASDNNSASVLTMRVGNEASMMFLLPIFVFLSFNGITKKKTHFLIYFSIVVFGSFYSLISGRKILELMVALSFMFTIFYRFFICNDTRNKLGRNFVFLCLITISIFLVIPLFNLFSSLISVDNLFEKAIETLSSGLSSTASGVIKRNENMKALFFLWLESPLFGNGLNSYASGSLANYYQMWSYEVVYNALLAQIGIIGMAMVVTIVVFFYKGLFYNFKDTKDYRFFALLIGLTSFIICGATNPMVYFIWPWVIVYSFSFKHIAQKEILYNQGQC